MRFCFHEGTLSLCVDLFEGVYCLMGAYGWDWKRLQKNEQRGKVGFGHTRLY